jgi:uncharacterized protein (TIGR02266 family)
MAGQQPRVILCGDNEHFLGPLADLVRDAGWESILVTKKVDALSALRGARADNTVLVIDPHHADVDALGLLKTLPPKGAPTRPHVVALRGPQEDAAHVANLKRHGVEWFFETRTSRTEIHFAINSFFHPTQVASNRRQHPRAPAEIAVQFWSGDEKPRDAVLKDISEGGAFIVTEANCRLGTEVKIKVKLPEISETVEASGEVVYKAPRMDRKSAMLPGLGLKFRELPPDVHDRIRAYVERVLKRMPDVYGKTLIGMDENPA